MKKTSKTIFLSLVLAAISFALTAQTVSFGYDDAGNRTSRTITLKSSEVNQTDTTDQVVEEEHFFDVLQEMKITISPNPNGGKFSVTVQNLPDKEYEKTIQLMLYGISGELIYQISELHAHSEIDISNRENGTYILVFISGNEKRTWKIVKQ